MKFIPHSNNGYGSSNPPFTNEDINIINYSTIAYDLKFITKLNKISEKEEWELDIEWQFYLFAGNVEFYEFHSNKTFLISDILLPPNDDDLINLISYSHKKLKENFEIRRDEYPFLPTVPELTDESILEPLQVLKQRIFPLL